MKHAPKQVLGSDDLMGSSGSIAQELLAQAPYLQHPCTEKKSLSIELIH